MIRKPIAVFGAVFLLILFACDTPVRNDKPIKQEILQKKVGNILFLFPPDGYANDNQEKLISECLTAIKTNCRMIGLSSFNDSITIHFLKSRQEMKKHTSTAAAGIALAHLKKVFIVAGGDAAEVRPPVNHELMHLISMLTWGDPHRQSHWMNEGLATLAAGNCNGFTPEQVHRYLSVEKKLLSIDSLKNNFYQQPEMIAYHQAAFIVQQLLQKYGAEKLKLLWMNGLDSFEKIYSTEFTAAYAQIQDSSSKQIPVIPSINWSEFEKGCF